MTLLLLAGALAALVALVLLATLWQVNRLLKNVPASAQSLAGQPWTPRLLRQTYQQLETRSELDYADQIPPKLERRYIVTGGNGLVGGYIVLQLLARGTPAENIRILDIRETQRRDMQSSRPARQVDFVPTDISSRDAVHAAFQKPWARSAAGLPLTVFHTAAVILASDRSEHFFGLPDAINVRGTRNVLAAARAAGADIFSSTSSASICVRPVKPFASAWASWGGSSSPAETDNFCQILDERDFFQPLRPRSEFFGNYPFSKALAERDVCAANSPAFRTGCIRPANGVYGQPTDNTVGSPLSKASQPTWIPHIVQSFVHGANVAVAHLQHEAVLARRDAPQAGRPFVVTDPNAPISYTDLYLAIATLSVHPFRVVKLQPVMLLLVAHAIEWYRILNHRIPALRGILPEMQGEAKHLQPGIFSICTHLIGSDRDARQPTDKGGLGYHGVLTTLQGITWEILEWNREHTEQKGEKKLAYVTSLDLAEQLRQEII